MIEAGLDGCLLSGSLSTVGGWYRLSSSRSICAFGSASGGSGCFGFVALGSSPALIALAILTAWYLEYLDLAVISGSTGAQMDMLRMSRKVDAAWNVSTVCLCYHQCLSVAESV